MLDRRALRVITYVYMDATQRCMYTASMPLAVFTEEGSRAHAATHTQPAHTVVDNFTT